MPIKDYVDYKKREFCNDVKCHIQMIMNTKEQDSKEYEELRGICKKNCIHSTYEFHHWLIEKGFLVVKPK